MKTKKILCLVLAFMLALSAMSISAFAAGTTVLGGSGTMEDPFIIKTLEDLVAFRDSVNAGETKYNADGVYVALGANIDMAGIDWSVNIGDDCNATFDGIFDGKGYTISNLTSTETAQKSDGYICTGLFGAIYGKAVVKNLTIDGATINTGDFTGNNAGAVVGFAYEATGSIENVTVKNATVNAAKVDGTGAIVGYAYTGALTINNCKVYNSEVTGQAYVGGVVGYAGGKAKLVANEVDTVTVTANSCCAGGVTGVILIGSAATDNVVNDVTLSSLHQNWLNSTGVVAGAVSGNNVAISGTITNSTDGIVGVIHTDKPSTPLNKVAASIGNIYYDSLNSAFAAAVDGDTIVLLGDATPELKSQRAITKASVIDLNGNTLTLTEDDLYFGTTTFKNGNIVVDPSVSPSTAVFWMFANQALTFDNVKLTATGVTGTYLIGLDGNNSDLSLLNGSEIIVDNNTALDLDIICVNASTGNDIVVDNSNINVKNLDGRVFFRGNYTISGASDIDLEGITKAGFRIEAGQTLNIADTATVDIIGEPRDGGIHLTATTAIYNKADTATVNASIYREPAADGSNLAEAVKITFEATADPAIYNIFVESTDPEKTINRLSTAQLKFALDPKNGEDINYTIAPAENVDLTTEIDDMEAYLFNFDGVNLASKSGVKILIGTVEFEGIGTFEFKADDTYSVAKVTAATIQDNIVTTYILGGSAAIENQGELDLDDSTTGDITLEEPRRDITINIAFNNNITAGNTAAYNDMTVTLVGANGEKHSAMVGDAAYTDDLASFTFDVTAGYRYTLTVEGAGYRTYKYTTIVAEGDDALVLNVWNNVKDNAVKVEETVAASACTKNFLAGDIVKDTEINLYDLSAVVSYFGTENLVADHPEYAKYDLNRDGVIDAKDVAYVLVSWGE